MTLLAQTPSPTTLHELAVVFAWGLGIAVGLASLWSLLRRRKQAIEQPVEVSLKDPVTVARDKYDPASCMSVHREIRERLQQHDREIAQLREESSKRTDAVVKHVEDVRVEVSGKLDQQAQEFGQALRDMPNQIIAILRNTNSLRR